MQTIEMNRKRCGDGDELFYVGYARVNSSVFSLALKVPRVLAALVFTVSWFQTVGAATEKARDETEVCVQYMVGVEDEQWRNIMSWWAGIPVTGHVGMPVDRGLSS